MSNEVRASQSETRKAGQKDARPQPRLISCNPESCIEYPPTHRTVIKKFKLVIQNPECKVMGEYMCVAAQRYPEAFFGVPPRKITKESGSGMREAGVCGLEEGGVCCAELSFSSHP